MLEFREDFIQRLFTSKGIEEETTRKFLASKGAYCADAELIAHCIKLGKLYQGPSFFEPKDEEELEDDGFLIRAKSFGAGLLLSQHSRVS